MIYYVSGCGCCGVSFDPRFCHVWVEHVFEFRKYWDGDDWSSYVHGCASTFCSAAPQIVTPLTAWDRLSVVALGTDDKDGGDEHDSTDPADWAALLTPQFNATFNPYPDGTVAGGTQRLMQNWATGFATTADWTQTFSYGGANYRITIPSGTSFSRNYWRGEYDEIVDEDDFITSQTYYAQYSCDVQSSWIEQIQ